MSRVFETFMIRDELDMLEVKLEEHDPFVDRWIIVESPVTHRGDPKPMHLLQNIERFAPWKDKITHVVAHLPPPDKAGDPWVREHVQRDMATGALAALCDDDDIVLLTDLDEFVPQPMPEPSPVLSFRMRLMMYAVDWEYPELHFCSVAARWRWLRGRSLAAVRDHRHNWRVADGGFHLTWLGGLEGQRRKLGVHCHLEMTPAEHDLIWNGLSYELGAHHGGAIQMTPVDVDKTWPRPIWEHRCPENWFRPR